MEQNVVVVVMHISADTCVLCYILTKAGGMGSTAFPQVSLRSTIKNIIQLFSSIGPHFMFFHTFVSYVLISSS